MVKPHHHIYAVMTRTLTISRLQTQPQAIMNREKVNGGVSLIIPPTPPRKKDINVTRVMGLPFSYLSIHDSAKPRKLVP